MQTWNINLETATDVDILDTLVGYVRFYELTSGGGADPRIRLKSLGGGINVEVLAGQGYRLPVPVRGLVVENMSGVALTGKLAISPESSGGFEDDRITGTVALSGPTLATMIAGKYNIRPEAPTNSINDATAAIMGTSAAPLLAPAANVNGIIILDGYMQDFGVTSQCMLAKLTSPVAVNDGQCLLNGCAPGYSSAGAVSEKFHRPIYVAAGLGIWLRSDAATSAPGASRRGFRYIAL